METRNNGSYELGCRLVGEPTPGSPRKRPTGGLVAILLLASAVRILPLPGMFVQGRLVPFADDPPYHLIRIQRFVHGDLDFRKKDGLLSYPRGDTACWPALFDLVTALVALPFRWLGEQAVVAAASLFVVLLGVSTVGVVFVLGRLVGGDGPGLLSALVLAILPAHVDYTIFGRVDHHAAEGLLVASIVLGLLTAARKKATTWPGLVTGLSLAFYPTAPLFSLMASLIGLYWYLWPYPAQQGRFALWLWLGVATSLAFSPHATDFVYFTPSLFHLVLYSALCIPILLRKGYPRAAPTTLLVIACVLVAGIALSSPDTFLAPLRFVLTDPHTALAFEAAPLWKDWGRFIVLLGFSWLLVFLGLIWVFSRGSRELRLLGLLAVVSSLMALSQRRFLPQVAPLSAVMAGMGAAFVATRIRLLTQRLPVVLAGVPIIVLSSWPSFRHLAALDPLTPKDRAAYVAAVQLAEHGLEGAPVLSPWSIGHVFQYAAKSPTVCDNFFGTPSTSAALDRCLRFYYETDEAKALERLRAWKVRVVVIDPPHPARIRAEAEVLGMDPGSFVTGTGELTPRVASTAWCRLGLFAVRAREGDTGPMGLRLLRKVEIYGPDGAVRAQLFLFLVPPPTPG